MVYLMKDETFFLTFLCIYTATPYTDTTLYSRVRVLSLAPVVPVTAGVTWFQTMPTPWRQPSIWLQREALMNHSRYSSSKNDIHALLYRASFEGGRRNCYLPPSSINIYCHFPPNSSYCPAPCLKHFLIYRGNRSHNIINNKKTIEVVIGCGRRAIWSFICMYILKALCHDIRAIFSRLVSCVT